MAALPPGIRLITDAQGALTGFINPVSGQLASFPTGGGISSAELNAAIAASTSTSVTTAELNAAIAASGTGTGITTAELNAAIAASTSTSVTTAQLNTAIATASGVMPVTWTALQATVGSVAGDSRWVTNIGGGSIWVYDGQRWKPIGGSVLLYNGPGFANKTDADTAEGTMASVIIPGGLMGPNDSIEYEFKVTSTSSSVPAVVKVVYGSSTMHQLNLTQFGVVTHGTFENQGVTNSQSGIGNNSTSYGVIPNMLTVATEDSTTTKTIALNIAFTTAGTGLTVGSLNSLWVRLLRG